MGLTENKLIKKKKKVRRMEIQIVIYTEGREKVTPSLLVGAY